MWLTDFKLFSEMNDLRKQDYVYKYLLLPFQVIRRWTEEDTFSQNIVFAMTYGIYM